MLASVFEKALEISTRLFMFCVATTSLSFILISSALASNAVERSASAGTPAKIIQSTAKQVALIELYTSEGCSSCPPADKWLTSLKSSPDLWKRWVPVAFHVDYWNYLGWDDDFAKPAFSQRQRLYGRQESISTYTPGFIVDGREWRGWFRGKSLNKMNFVDEPGVLKATIDGAQVSVEFAPKISPGQKEIHWALLGFDYKRPIRGGENRGRQLVHDFVVVDQGRLNGVANGNKWTGDFVYQTSQVPAAKQYGIAIWVSEPGRVKPIQAVGDWL
jgi:hypothetical protein